MTETYITIKYENSMQSNYKKLKEFKLILLQARNGYRIKNNNTFFLALLSLILKYASCAFTRLKSKKVANSSVIISQY